MENNIVFLATNSDYSLLVNILFITLKYSLANRLSYRSRRS